MCRDSSESRRSEAGFTIIEILVVVLIVALLGAITIPVYQNAVAKSQRMALAGDLKALHTAFLRYNVDHGKFPADAGDGALDPATLTPLSAEGYFENVTSLAGKLEDGQLEFYIGLDLRGADSDYIAAVSSSTVPGLQAYVISWDWGVVGAGLEGVYFVNEEGILVGVDEIN
jgi:prepilin-type N-terminal cleavage/methylation domain-containing protein